VAIGSVLAARLSIMILSIRGVTARLSIMILSIITLSIMDFTARLSIKISGHKQGTLTEGQGSVWLTSSLR
jgi:hypothetical protein